MQHHVDAGDHDAVPIADRQPMSRDDGRRCGHAITTGTRRSSSACCTACTTKITKKNIASREKLSNSMMPSGLNQALSKDDLVNLVAYLSSLKAAK